MNVKRVFRVERHGTQMFDRNYNVGPFALNRVGAGNVLNTFYRPLMNTLISRDDTYNRFYCKVMSYDIYKKLKMVPASFTMERPGPNEDPLLREKFMKIPMQDKLDGLIPFCFESMHCLRKWFSDSKENLLLHHNDFVIGEYRVRTDRIISGYKQSVFIDNPDNLRIGSTPII